MPIFVIIWSCFWILEVPNLKLPTFFYEKKDSIHKLSAHIFLFKKLATSLLKILDHPFFKIQGQKWTKSANFRQKLITFLNFRSFKFEVGNFFLWKKWFNDEIVWSHFFASEVGNFIAQNCRFFVFQNIEWKMDLNSNILHNMVLLFIF